MPTPCSLTLLPRSPLGSQTRCDKTYSKPQPQPIKVVEQNYNRERIYTGRLSQSDYIFTHFRSIGLKTVTCDTKKIISRNTYVRGDTTTTLAVRLRSYLTKVKSDIIHDVVVVITTGIPRLVVRRTLSSRRKIIYLLIFSS